MMLFMMMICPVSFGSQQKHIKPLNICLVNAMRDSRLYPPATRKEISTRLRKCLKSYCTRPSVYPYKTTVKYVDATLTQRNNIARTINLGIKMRMDKKEIASAVNAITVETRALNLPYGHSSSVGILQLLDIHGSYEWRMVIENSVGWYYRGARQLNTKNMKIWEIAAAVQRPAVPTVYRDYQVESLSTTNKYVKDWLFCFSV